MTCLPALSIGRQIWSRIAAGAHSTTRSACVRQIVERDQRTGDAFAVEPGSRLGLIPCNDCREGETRHTLRKLARQGFADLAQPGNGDTLG